MITCRSVPTVYEMMAKGAVLVVKRIRSRGDENLVATLVNPHLATSTPVEVESATAKRATNGGRMARMDKETVRNKVGYRQLGFVDDTCEYWSMLQ